MMALHNVCGGTSVGLPYGLVSCKLWTMRGKSRAKSKAAEEAVSLGFGGSRNAQEKWQCARGCGACCKLDKGPAFPKLEEIFDDDPVNLEVRLV